MFSAITKELDGLLKEDSFCLTVAYLYNLPVWKLIGFYFYTFTIKDKELARSYRQCVKWVKFPYALRYQLFKLRLRNFFG